MHIDSSYSGNMLITPILQRGLLKEVKGLGWYLDEQDIAQVSMNLCDYNVTSLHTVYEECCKISKVRSGDD